MEFNLKFMHPPGYKNSEVPSFYQESWENSGWFILKGYNVEMAFSDL
jgi:hypothetical protein